MAPALAVAPKATVPLPQIAPGVVPVMDGIAFTVTAAETLLEIEHPFELETTQ